MLADNTFSSKREFKQSSDAGRLMQPLSRDINDNRMFCSMQSFSIFLVQGVSVLVAALAMVSDGMQYGWASPAVPRFLQNHSSIEITKDETKWIVNSYIAGNVLGVLLSVSIFNKLSRKLSIFIASVPILLGWIGNLVAPTLVVLCLARLVGGIGRNMAYVAVPMYIGEIADPKIRAVLGSFMYVSMNIGVLTVYAITPFLPLYIPPIIGILVVVLQTLLLKLIPESPYYLLTKHDQYEAKKSLKILRRSNNVDNELREISAAVQRQTEGTAYSLFEMLGRLFTKSSNLKALGIILILRALQMFSGVSVMTMHIHSIFEQAGGNLSPEVSSIIYVLIMLSSSLFSATTADRFGRRSLMIFSCTFTALVLLLQGIYFYLKIDHGFNMSSITWVPILNIVVFVLMYRIGLGTVPIVMVSELFPADVKVAGVVLADLVYSISSLLSNIVFQYTEEAFGIFTPFWIFSGCCIFGAVLSVLFIPETKGITLEEIQYLLMNKTYKKESRSDQGTSSTAM